MKKYSQFQKFDFETTLVRRGERGGSPEPGRTIQKSRGPYGTPGDVRGQLGSVEVLVDVGDAEDGF